ncbi:MAG: hypothetical protein HKN39_03580 [Flavobacteriales bacterium]|nr:hypothetical protein [Flavobacteriales bacterium]
MKKFILLSMCSLIALTFKGQADIAEARSLAIGTTVTVTGIVTNGNEFGSIRYVEDGTAGIAAYPGADWSSWTEPIPGDEVTITGVLKDYNGLLEIDPITAVSIDSQGNDLPTPQIITPAQINENVEAELVTIENAVFVNAGQSFTSTTWEFNSNGESGVIYLRSGNPIIGELVPGGPVTLTAISSQFTFNVPANDGYQLLPRTMADIISDSPVNFVSPVSQTNLTTSGFELNWLTDASSNSIIKWGFSPDALDNVIDDNTQTTDHTLSISGLDAGTIIYATVCSVLGTDTIESNIGAYATVSNSSGTMDVFFNNTVDVSVSTGVDAVWTSNIHDTIIKYLDMAEISIDMAVYSNNNLNIVGALNDAHNSGIQVRVITEGSNNNISLSSLDPGITIVERTDGMGSGMHNKFFIVDPNSVDNSFVIQGSMNMTNTDMFQDYNNIIITQDQSLAKAYQLEFNEMWGSDGPVPNLSNSRFGPDKANNTPHNFIIGGRPVEMYFSPSDGTTAAIKKSVLSSDASFEFNLFVFTNNELRDAVLEVNDLFFVTPRGIIDNTSTTGSDYDALLAAGVDVQSHEGVPGLLHHKLAIVDQANPGSDPQVITGSHNWSSSAESVNDENTLIIHDATIANMYFQEFEARWAELVGLDELSAIGLTLYPNPASNMLYIDGVKENMSYDIISLSGQTIHSGGLIANERGEIDITSLPAALYLLKVSLPDHQTFLQGFVKSQY